MQFFDEVMVILTGAAVQTVITVQKFCSCCSSKVVDTLVFAQRPTPRTTDVTVAFLVAAALEAKEEEEKERLRRQREAAEHEARMQELDRRVQNDVPLRAGHLPPKKRKNMRKRKLPKTSSHLTLRRALRPQQQWYVHGWFCCFGASRAVFPSFVGRSQLPGIMDDMDQNGSSLRALVFDSGTSICKDGFASFLALCSSTLSSGPRCSATWPVLDRCLEEYRKIGFYWEMTSNVSVFSSLVLTV